MLLHSDCLEQRSDLLLSIRAPEVRVPVQGKGDVFFNAQRIVECGLLEQEPYLYPDLV